MREILVFDILQYCKLLDFVKQNKFSFKLLMLKLKTDWEQQSKCWVGGDCRPYPGLCVQLTFS